MRKKSSATEKAAWIGAIAVVIAALIGVASSQLNNHSSIIMNGSPSSSVSRSEAIAIGDGQAVAISGNNSAPITQIQTNQQSRPR